MPQDEETVAGFDALLAKYPWPDEPVYPEVPVVGRSVRGYELIEETLEKLGKPNPIIMEIGAEFGASTRRGLAVPGSYVVSIDPWKGNFGFRDWPQLAHFKGTDRAVYDLFQSFNFENRHRLVAVREFSPAGPKIVYDAGVKPDLIYIDGDHAYDAVIRDLTVVTTLFPDAIVAGDDWNWRPRKRVEHFEGISKPVQVAVKRWAAFHGVGVVTNRNTWMIDQSQSYNLGRLAPSFGKGASTGTNLHLSERLRAIEATQRQLVKDQRALVASLRKKERNKPTSRLARKVRATVKR